MTRLVRKLAKPKSWEAFTLLSDAIDVSEIPISILTEFMLRPGESGVSLYEVSEEDSAQFQLVVGALCLSSPNLEATTLFVSVEPMAIQKAGLNLVTTAGATGVPVVDALHREIVPRGLQDIEQLARLFVADGRDQPQSVPENLYAMSFVQDSSALDFGDVFAQQKSDRYRVPAQNLLKMLGAKRFAVNTSLLSDRLKAEEEAKLQRKEKKAKSTPQAGAGV